MSGTSHPEGRSWAFDMVAAYAPVSVLDVGAGSGTYAREWRDRLPAAHWTGIEVHQPYVDRYRLEDLYDMVLVRDARDGLVAADLVILGDVVEHMPMGDGRALLRSAMTVGDAVLLSVPLGRYDQGEIDGNPHEAHHATWEHEDVVDVLGPCPFFRGDVLGVYFYRTDR